MRSIDAEFMGRVDGIWTALDSGVRIAAIGLGGVCVAAFGARSVFVAAGFFGIAGSVVGFGKLIPALRKMTAQSTTVSLDENL